MNASMISMKQWRGLSKDGNTITLNKFKGDFLVAPYATPDWLIANAGEIGTGAVVDVETTGLEFSRERVIEIGVRTFRFQRSSGQLLVLDESYEGLQDPGKPLSPEISLLTGLKDEDLKGKTTDWKKVRALLESAEIIIAHNAKFDRPFIEMEIGEKLEKIWACTLKQIPWSQKGFGVAKLDILSAYHGYFTDAHRALNDVDALLHLVSMEDGMSGAPYLWELVNNAVKRIARVDAFHSPFESKDLLKARGYHWNAGDRVWSKTCYQEELSEEIGWLETSVYLGPFRGRTSEIPLHSHFLPE